MRKSSNHSHPEQLEGEVFLTNSTCEYYGDIGWKTKRMSKIAYDVDGKSIPITGIVLHGLDGSNISDLYPVFVQRNEIANSDLDEGLKKKILN